MTVSSATSSTSTSSSTSSSSTASSASSAYDTFLTLLITQLKNQDPMNATDPNQFTSELIQLNSLNQQVESNSYLSTISSSINSLSLSSGVGYIGKTVEVDSADAPLTSGGSATWTYDLSSASASTSLTITDSNGNTVWTGDGDTTAGDHTISWNGTESDGTTASAGSYTLTVTAKDSSGSAVTSSVASYGTVTGVASSSGTAEVVLGNSVTVPLTDILAIAS